LQKQLKVSLSNRAGLKADATDAVALGPRPMGAPRLWWSRASEGPTPCVWIVVHFCQIPLELKFSRKGL